MTIPELADHQSVAVTRVLELLEEFGGVLLADEPGLGKSFIAAAVARALSDQRFATELVVPASLLEQWRRTLDQFEVDARLQSHDSLLSERWVPRAGRRLLVVDEAHAFRNPRTRRYDALARRSIGSRLLLITATPFCNRAEDLLALLALIAPDDALRRCGVPSIRRAFDDHDLRGVSTTLSALMIRRGRDVLPPDLFFGRLERRVVRHPVPDLPSLRELRFPLLERSVSQELLRRLLVRRLESSESALAESLARQKRFYERALDALAGGRQLTRRDYRSLFANDERDDLQQVLFWELFAPEATASEPEQLEQEITTLGQVRAELERSPQAKERLLLSILTEDATPTLVFTEAVATARSLYAVLRHQRRTGLATSHDRRPDRAIDAFVRGAVDVLVATDLVSEGLDLQRAGRVVHYDLPWNPVRMEQRNGRAFRIGQRRASVISIYFVPERDGWNSGVESILVAKQRARRGLLDRFSEDEIIPNGDAVRLRRTALPRHLPGDGAEWMLRKALRSYGLDVPPELLRPHRAGLSRLIREMAAELLDADRLQALEELLRHETMPSLI